jgi:hypothetical protein
MRAIVALQADRALCLDDLLEGLGGSLLLHFPAELRAAPKVMFSR